MEGSHPLDALPQTAERGLIMATCQICKYAVNEKDKYPCSECKGYSKYKYEKLQANEVCMMECLKQPVDEVDHDR